MRPTAGVVWDSDCGFIGLSHRPLLTKTSRLLNQLTGKSRCLCMAFFHVFIISFVYVLFLTIFVAVMRSHVTVVARLWVDGNIQVCQHGVGLFVFTLFNFRCSDLSCLPSPCDLVGQSPGLFPYGGRESWHVQENGRIYCESVDSWGQGGNVRVCQHGVLTL